MSVCIYTRGSESFSGDRATPRIILCLTNVWSLRDTRFMSIYLVIAKASFQLSLHSQHHNEDINALPWIITDYIVHKYLKLHASNWILNLETAENLRLLEHSFWLFSSSTQSYYVQYIHVININLFDYASRLASQRDNVTSTAFAITHLKWHPINRSAIDFIIAVISTRSVCNRCGAAARLGNSGGRRSSATPKATTAAKCWRIPPTTRPTTFPEPALALWSSVGQEVEHTSIKIRVGARYSWVFRAIRFYEGEALPDHARSFIVGTFRGMRLTILARWRVLSSRSIDIRR